VMTVTDGISLSSDPGKRNNSWNPGETPGRERVNHDNYY
jgi:hypothetical protein